MYTRQWSPTTCCGWLAYCQPDARHGRGFSHPTDSRAPLTAQYVLVGASSGFLSPLTVKNSSPTRHNHVCHRPIRGPYTPCTRLNSFAYRYASLKSGLPDRNSLGRWAMHKR